MGQTAGQVAMARGAAPDHDQAQDPLPAGEENPTDNGTATRPALGPSERAHSGRRPPSASLGRTTGQDQFRQRATPLGNRTGQNPSPFARTNDDSSPASRNPGSRSPTGEQRPFQGTQPPGSQPQVVGWDEDNDRPIYNFSRTTYRTDTQAMENWRDGAAGGQSSRAGQPMNAQPGNGPPGRSLWPQASSYGPGADPVARPSPLQTTGTGNPDAPGATPSPAPAVASSSGTQQPRAPKGPKNPKPVPPKGPARKATVDTDSEED